MRRRLLCFAFFVVAWMATSASAALIGTFDASRVGDANLINGAYNTLARASLHAHLPQVTLVGIPNLSPATLAGLDGLMISNTSGVTTTTPLSPSEQTALLSFVASGKSALILADGYGLHTAKTFVEPFLLTELSYSGLDVGYTVNYASGVTNGPFGVVDTATSYFGGFFYDLGPYATALINLRSYNSPEYVSIERNVMSPGSGRVILGTDSSMVADPSVRGVFSANETLFLNSVAWILPVPEPSTGALAFVAGALLICWAARLRFARTQETASE